jgi:NAD(P)-dependent dehydrogenase (short-subunit alcohol dehydrogenase family)
MIVGLTGKVVLVTGAASGIGAAIARLAAASGPAGLMLTDMDAHGLARTASDVAATGAAVATFLADLASPAAPGDIIAAAIARFGRIDALVNCAGLTTRAALTDATPALWETLFAVNARAPFFLMQAAVRDMLARRAPGSIVNILSVNAHVGLPELSVYAATKGAMQTLTKNAANAHLSDRIRVNGINLGWVATEAEDHMQSVTLGKGPGWQAEAAARLPLGRLVTADEAARVALYLLSDASVPLTGSATDLEQHVYGAPP